jgi:hypothetical protein
MRQNAGLLSRHVSRISMPIFRSTIVSTAFWCPNLQAASSMQRTQLTVLCYATQTAYRFGHQKVVLTIVLLKMGILMLGTC